MREGSTLQQALQRCTAMHNGCMSGDVPGADLNSAGFESIFKLRVCLLDHSQLLPGSAAGVLIRQGRQHRYRIAPPLCQCCREPVVPHRDGEHSAMHAGYADDGDARVL